MSCPDIGILEQELTFTIQSRIANGTPTDTDSLPTYKIYEELTNTEIASGTMAKQDDTNTDGYYAKKIDTTTGNGFESLKTYTIRIETCLYRYLFFKRKEKKLKKIWNTYSSCAKE